MKEKYKNLGRIFSIEFKLRQVDMLNRKLVTIRDVCEAHDVSATAVYKWLRKYSPHYKHRTRIVVEMESEARKNKELLARIAELESMVGRKQMEIEYLDKLIEISSDELGVDIRKKGELPRSNGSASEKGSTAGK